MKKNRLLAIVLAVLLLAGALGGCAASTKSPASAPMASYDTAAGGNYKSEIGANQAAETPAAEAPMESEIAAEESGEFVNTKSYDVEGQDDAADSVSDGAQSLSDKIIYSASLSIQTTEFDDSIAALEKSVKEFGGFVENSNVSGNVTYNSDGTTHIVDRYASYTVRIPAKRFEEFLRLSNGLGSVTDSGRYAENVTSQYTDYEARLSSLRTQEERLLSMLEKSEDVESLIALEQRLADVRYELESIERNLRNLDMQIGYSTVDIMMWEVEKYTPTAPVKRTFGEKLSDALKNGWDSFTSGLQYFLIDLVYALPGLILFLLIAAAVVVVIVKLNRRRRARKAAKQAAQTPPQTPPAEDEAKK